MATLQFRAALPAPFAGRGRRREDRLQCIGLPQDFRQHVLVRIMIVPREAESGFSRRSPRLVPFRYSTRPAAIQGTEALTGVSDSKTRAERKRRAQPVVLDAHEQP
jgi:hypothetical protein